HTRSYGDWSSDVCSSDLLLSRAPCRGGAGGRIGAVPARARGSRKLLEMSMDWDKLRVFHAVAEPGSFTHAGEALNLSQSAVSRQDRKSGGQGKSRGTAVD